MPISLSALGEISGYYCAAARSVGALDSARCGLCERGTGSLPSSGPTAATNWTISFTASSVNPSLASDRQVSNPARAYWLGGTPSSEMQTRFLPALLAW
jgi:hypothetical protein